MAGDLGALKDQFVTMSGRKVELGIYVEHGKEARAAYAMDALKRSMRWDEERFGREYDLDVFNIVAVSDFNMGAMENKGLNVFNDKYVLADEETATDTDFANIEAVIAHEYFHNWTGNRITCRDWFQLCLKEGLTVFRDHEFSADQRSRAVKRIAEVRTLRAHQFPEDQGPLAHPVRPRRYREINNFYTSTVYEKGSEVVRMIRTILGAETFREGMDLYFERHDGEAATVENFLKVFEDVSGRDLSQFALWYHQAGTPNLTVTTSHNAARRRIRRRDRAVGAADAVGKPQAADAHPAGLRAGRQPTARTSTTAMSTARRSRTASSMSASAAMSCASATSRSGRRCRSTAAFPRRSRSAIEQTQEERVFLARHDSDPFSRWQAFNSLLTDALMAASRQCRGGKAAGIPGRADRPGRRDRRRRNAEPAFRALALALPGEADIARELGTNIDPDAIFAAREALAKAIAEANAALFEQLFDELGGDKHVQPRCGERRPAGAAQRAARLSQRRLRRSGPRGAAVRRGHQHDRPLGGADDAGAAPHGRRRRPRQALAAFETALPRRSAGARQMVPDPGEHPGPARSSASRR